MHNECPYLRLVDKGDCVCTASLTNMIPSPIELRLYCTTEDHYRCPILLSRTLREGARRGARLRAAAHF